MGICQCSHLVEKDYSTIISANLNYNVPSNNISNTIGTSSNTNSHHNSTYSCVKDYNNFSTTEATYSPLKKQNLSKFKSPAPDFTQSYHSNEDSIIKYEPNINNNINSSTFSKAKRKEVLESYHTSSSVYLQSDFQLVFGDKELINVLVLGGPAVGKSSLLIKIIQNKFEKHYIPTIGIEQKKKNVKLNGKIIEFNYIVTAGDKTYKENYKVIYKKIQAIFLMYDVTSIESFIESMRLYENEVKVHFNEVNMQMPIIYFIGNKIDEMRRKVSIGLAKDFCEKNNLINYEISVKTGSNVRLLLNDLLGKCALFNVGIGNE